MIGKMFFLVMLSLMACVSAIPTLKRMEEMGLLAVPTSSAKQISHAMKPAKKEDHQAALEPKQKTSLAMKQQTKKADHPTAVKPKQTSFALKPTKTAQTNAEHPHRHFSQKGFQSFLTRFAGMHGDEKAKTETAPTQKTQHQKASPAPHMVKAKKH